MIEKVKSNARKEVSQPMNLHTPEMKNKDYRQGVIKGQIGIDLPFQIRALRKQMFGTQPEMAKATGIKQSRISYIEKPGKAHFTLESLCELADKFDVALIVRFAPFSELLDWSNKFNPDTFRVATFAEEECESTVPVDVETPITTSGPKQNKVVVINGPRQPNRSGAKGESIVENGYRFWRVANGK